MAITSIFIGLPVSILLYRDAVRASFECPAEHKKAKVAILTLPIRILGAVSIFMGLSILAWVGYNIFFERLSQFPGIKSYGQLVLPVLLVFVGYRWLKRPVEKAPNDGST